MHFICSCGSSFKRSGLYQHQKRSNDPCCKSSTEDYEFNSASTDGQANEIRTDSDPVKCPSPSIEVDPAGDFFGDYIDYSMEDLGWNNTEDMPEFEETFTREDEQGLEPERHPNSEIINQQGTQPEETSIGVVRLRGGAEAELRNKPYAIKFTRGRAGAIYSRDGMDVNTAYTNNLGPSNNMFVPFSSKMEWEIAHWAKTRGPSSTAFSELMNIDGVSE